jgi:WD40 repeat protein
MKELLAFVETNRVKSHDRFAAALCLLPHGLLASGSGFGEEVPIRVRDMLSGAEIAQLISTKTDWCTVLAMTCLPDGRLASGGEDGIIRIWDLASGTETDELHGHNNWVVGLCVLPSGRLASSSGDNTVRLWNLVTNTETNWAVMNRSSVYASWRTDDLHSPIRYWT